MVSEARRIGSIGINPIPDARKFMSSSAQKRLDLAYRLIDNPLIGNYLMRSPVFTIMGQTRDLKRTIIETLSYDNQFANDIVDAHLRRIDRLSDVEIMDRANKQIADFHEQLRSKLPVPDVKGFFNLRTFGEFDPQQYFLSNTFGIVHTIYDAMLNKDLPNINQRMYDTAIEKFMDGYIMLRATEIASRQ